jgi:hypothetical protein
MFRIFPATRRPEAIAACHSPVMRNAAGVMLVGVVLISAAPARSEPNPEQPAAADAPASHRYVEVGYTLGIDRGFTHHDAVFVAGGYLVGGATWLRARVTAGAAHSDWGDGSYYAARFGVENRQPIADSAYASLVFGADVELFHDELKMGDSITAGRLEGRLALDLGTRRIRIRPGIGLMYETGGSPGFDLFAATAYQW